MGTNLEYLVNRLCVSMMTCVLMRSDLSIVLLSELCHRCSLGMSCQSSICLHDAMVSHWESLFNRYLSPICHWYSLGVPCQLQSSICFHDTKGTHRV